MTRRVANKQRKQDP